jgi:hypothetical protein
MPLVCVLLAVCSAVAFAQPADLLLYAPFDGTADAAFAQGSAVQSGSSSLAFVPGLRGQAASISNDCRFAVEGNFRPEAGTVAMWVRSTWSDKQAAGRYLFCLYGSRDIPESYHFNRFSLYFGAEGPNFVVWGSDGKSRAIAPRSFTWKPQEWHHVAATWRNINSGRKDAELAVYVDGKSVAFVKGIQLTVGPTDTAMALGRDQDGSPDYLDAEVDDVYLYNRALTAEEISAAVAAIRAGSPYEVTGTGIASRQVSGWWNADWPYRAAVTLPAAAEVRRDVFVQCPLRISGELAALGTPAVADPGSLRVVSADGQVIPAAVQDGLLEWKVSGEVPAGEARRFWVYCRPATYRITGPLQSQRLGAPAAPPTASLTPPDYATDTFGKSWDFNDGSLAGIDSWGDKPDHIQNRKVEDGILSMDVNTDPYFIWGVMWGPVGPGQRAIALDVDRYPVLEMRVRQSVQQSTWQLFGRIGTTDQLFTYSFPVSGTGWQRLRVDLRKDARWKGVLSAFRIDPTDKTSAHIDIDWIRLSSVVPVQHDHVEAIGSAAATPERARLSLPQTRVVAGAAQDLTVTLTDAQGRGVAGQPVRIELSEGSGGELQAFATQSTLALSNTSRRGITDAQGRLRVRYLASRKAQAAADVVTAVAEFSALPRQEVKVDTVPGEPHHYRVEPTQVLALRPVELPVKLQAQLVDEFDNPVAGVRSLRWTTDEGGSLTDTGTATSAQGSASATWRGDEAKRWVYQLRVSDDQGLTGTSSPICLIASTPRRDPVVLGPKGYFQKGVGGPGWLPLGGFYANWVGLPENGEEGRRLISFVDATEEQLSHWLDFLASQGVTAMRFMLRAHTPRGMEPMDVIGQVNMPLFAKVLRYLDLARKHDIRFMLTIHEDYTKPAYYNLQALQTFCLPYFAGRDLSLLPAYQQRFLRERRLLDTIDLKYTDPDARACQDQYTRQIVGLLKDNPQLFSWEFENEMVNCPAEWANHMAAVIRSVDPITPICASHGGGGLHTADPLWWTTKTDIDFYTYHIYPNLTTTSPQIDYGASVDILTRYGRMAGVCMLGESAGDEWSRYPQERDSDRRYLMRDIIWFSLVNGNPGCFFWNSRGYEVEQFRLANRIASGLNWADWEREKPSIAVAIPHPLDDDKYFRTPQGRSDYAAMGQYDQGYLSAGVDFDFTPTATGYPTVCALSPYQPAQAAPTFGVGPGWQVAFNARKGGAEGLAYLRNFAGVRNWKDERVNLYLRDRAERPLKIKVNLPTAVQITATDLDTGEAKTVSVQPGGEIDLGISGHDWALLWRK